MATIEEHDPRTGKPIDSRACLGFSPREEIFSPDADLIACIDQQTVPILKRGEKWRKLATIRNDNNKHFTGIAFHPSGKYLAATSNDTTVKLYDTATWELAKTFTWDIGRMRSIAFSPDGTLAAAGSDKGKVVIWDVDL